MYTIRMGSSSNYPDLVAGTFSCRGIVEPVDDFRATNPPSNGPLLDAIVAVTGVPRRPSSHWPNGTKAIVYHNRNQYDPVGDRVLETFGQASRNSVCACDTSTDPSLSQVMHLAVGDTVGPRVKTAARGGVLKEIIHSHSTPESVIEAIFIRLLSRSKRCQPPNLGNLRLAYFWWLAPLSWHLYPR